MELLFINLYLALLNGIEIIPTSIGYLAGIRSASEGVTAFLGIPYAEPPVKNLRFAKPVPKSPWSPTLLCYANQLPPSCVQVKLDLYIAPDPNFPMSEDCLYLNIWRPEKKISSFSQLKPIMIFIYGGGFIFGSTNQKVYDGAALAKRGDVIVATINYRVGTLGYFYGFTKEAEGNMGMYDQVLAIKWIKDNAMKFGGDPNKITLFGESAGGFSVSLHLISPLSRNLFRRGILESGTAVSPFFSEDNGIENLSSKIANLSGCANDSSLADDPKAVVDCMKNLPSEKFQEVDKVLMKSLRVFLLRIGDRFLPKSAVDEYKRGNFKNTEILLGVNRDEGTVFLTFELQDQLGLFGEKSRSSDFNETFARQYLQNYAVIGNEEDVNEVKEAYLDAVNQNNNLTYRKTSANFAGDYVITCSAIFQAEYYSRRRNPVYFYRFDYRPDSSPFAEWMGVTHFDEIQYVFGIPLFDPFTDREKELSKFIMDIWTSFAKTGYPSIPGGTKFPLYSSDRPKYFAIGKNGSVEKDGRPDDNRCDLWRDVFHTND